MNSYEQKELLAAVESDEQTVRDMERKKIDLKLFLETMRECTGLKELTPTLVNTLIKRIEVHNGTVDENGVKHVPVGSWKKSKQNHRKMRNKRKTVQPQRTTPYPVSPTVLRTSS